MLNNKTFLAVIPARGGSKRLPRKNILDLNGKPLIQWTIESGQKSKYIDKLIVSSDDEEILNLSASLCCDTIKRPENISSDLSTTFEALKHVIDNVNTYDYIILLQATSPLRNEIQIDDAIEFLVQKNADSIISVCETDHSPLWTNILDKSLDMSSFLSSEILNKRSQDLPKYFRLNGAIYICKTDVFLENKSFFLNKNVFAYIMDKNLSIDIDDKLDFTIAETIMKKLKV